MNGGKPNRKKRFTVTLDIDVVKQARKRAIDENISFSTMVERLLIAYCEQEGEG